jgi:anti-sigma factor RsiW
MECDRASALLHPLIDGELGLLGRQRLLRHVARCGGCAGRLSDLQALQTALRTKLQYHRAPPALAARIGAAIARESPSLAPARRHLSGRRGGVPAGFGLAGGLVGAAAGVALTLLVTGAPIRPGGDMVSAVLDSHVRSLLPNHLTDVVTSDRHTVKPWLSSRVDVSPPVRDLAEEGFPLIGGRVDYVDGHQVGAVVYRHDRHIINLLAWSSPGKADEGLKTLSRQGFNLITWRKGGVTFWAVSDLEAAELRKFALAIAAAG